MLTVEGWMTPNVDVAAAWSVLTDYARFPRFVPGIHVSRVLERSDGAVLVEQRGEIGAGQLRVPYDGLLRIEETPHERIRIQFVSGPFKDARGEWGIQAGKPPRLGYRLHMDLMKSPFPPPLAPGIAEQQVRTWVEVFAREMERVMDNRK